MASDRLDVLRGRDPGLVDEVLRELQRTGRLRAEPAWKPVYRELMEQAARFLCMGNEYAALTTCQAALDVAMLDGSAGWVEWARECMWVCMPEPEPDEDEDWLDWDWDDGDDCSCGVCATCAAATEQYFLECAAREAADEIPF